MSGGFYTAISSNTVIIDFRTVLVYPLLFQGALEILFGVAVAVFGYLLFHGKIGYFNST